MDEISHGGARKGAGRKPKIDEIAIAEQMDAIMIPNIVWSALSTRVIDGDVNAIKTWLGYRFGMPKQVIEQKNTNIDAGKLTPDEVKIINQNLDKSY
jgi:hypothetical protein